MDDKEYLLRIDDELLSIKHELLVMFFLLFLLILGVGCILAGLLR